VLPLAIRRPHLTISHFEEPAMNALRIALLTLFVSPSTLLAAAPTTESTESYKSTTEQETVRFDNETFILAYRNEDSGKTIREFLPARQKLESWTKLAAIHEFLELNDADEYALQLERTAKEQYPKSPTAVQKNEKTGQVLVDFVACRKTFRLSSSISFVSRRIRRAELWPNKLRYATTRTHRSFCKI
jgi:hypothetical protein